jgi:uncharacterized protein YyaL (SSP411 family)
MTTSQLNSLSGAASAYLRSAMHQPVRWNEWGPEVFAEAQRKNKPILLDIGAVWCHWCHVMDRESYDSAEIAELINERFIAIKVDRDERPDIDSRYQLAVSSITGQGGWPLTAFLTPDGKPFYGGTYFPPDDHYGRPSFKRVLLSIANAYREKHEDVVDQAKMVETVIAQAESHNRKSGEFSPEVIEGILRSARKMFDEVNGGFGSAPKFPHPAILDLIIHQYSRTGDEELREMFASTLEKMARGGVYDQLGGGFHRYSVDERWIVPHFEKMSYDNSELLKNYVHAFQATKLHFFADVAINIIRWMDEWLSDRERGGFYASQDADYSMDDDGDYFTWTLAEARAALSEEEARVASLYYDINEIGEMHHDPAKNVLYVRASIDEISKRLGIGTSQVKEILQSAKAKMYAARLKRPTPYVDKTIYVGWNALSISAYINAATLLKLDGAGRFGLRSLDRVLAEGWDDKSGLKHVIAYSDPAATSRAVPGVLDDYAFTVIACLDAYEATAEIIYFNNAKKIADCMIAQYFDDVSGGFFDTARGDRHGSALGVLGTGRKPFQDSPTPAGNSAACIALLRLHSYTSDENYREKAARTLELISGSAEQYGLFAATYGLAAVHYSQPHTQVAIVGDGENADKLYDEAVAAFSITKSVIPFSSTDLNPKTLPPSLAETLPHVKIAAGSAAAIICSNFSCRPAVYELAELAEALRESMTGTKRG